MGLEELFEADFVNTFGSDVANQTIIVRRVDFAQRYCEVVSKFVEELINISDEDAQQDKEISAAVFARLGAMLTAEFFGGIE